MLETCELRESVRDAYSEAALRPAVEVLDGQLDQLGTARTNEQADHQAMLGVVGDVVPTIAAVVLSWTAVLLLLGDKGPLLVELDLTGFWGKKPRVRRGVAGRVRRPGQRSGRPCPC